MVRQSLALTYLCSTMLVASRYRLKVQLFLHIFGMLRVYAICARSLHFNWPNLLVKVMLILYVMYEPLSAPWEQFSQYNKYIFIHVTTAITLGVASNVLTVLFTLGVAGEFIDHLDIGVVYQRQGPFVQVCLQFEAIPSAGRPIVSFMG